MEYLKRKKGLLIKVILCAVVTLVIVLFPFPADNLFLRFHFREGGGSGYRLYYTTADHPDFDGDRYIDGIWEPARKEVSFKINGSLENRILLLRMDFPSEELTYTVDSVSASSGGAVKNRWSVTDIFDSGSMLVVNDMTVQVVPARDIAIIFTSEGDPFVAFTPEITSSLTAGHSHKVLTRICIMCLVFIGTVFYRKNIFSGEKNEKTQA